MSLLSALARGIYWTLGLLQGAGEVIGAGKKLVKAARQLGPDDTDPVPLTRRSLQAKGPQSPKR